MGSSCWDKFGSELKSDNSVVTSLILFVLSVLYTRDVWFLIACDNVIRINDSSGPQIKRPSVGRFEMTRG